MDDVLPGVLGGRDVGFAVEGNVGKGVVVDELDGPVEEADETAEEAEEDGADDVAGLGFAALRDGHRLAHELDQADDETAEADAAEGVRHRAAEGAASGARGHAAGFLGAEVPRAVDAGDGSVDRLADELSDPVACERHEDEQADDFGVGTPAGTLAAGGVVARMVLDVDGRQGDGEPGAKGGGDQAADEGDGEHVAVSLGDIDDGLQHQHGKGDAWDPADEADDVEDGEEEEDDSGRIVVTRKVVERGAETDDDL